jgi:nitrogen regulatory protein PII
MKAVFITFDQAHYERIIDILDRQSCRGFTAWPQVSGRGSRDGEPHYGSHAWPSLAQAIMTVVEDSRLQALLAQLKALDNERPKLGLRAFVLPVDQAI